MLLESGPILGLAFLIWRSAVVLHLLRFAVREVRFGNCLPILLFSAGVFILLQGPFGQPTTLGFAVVFTGLGFAAKLKDDIDTEPESQPKVEPKEMLPPPKMRRSPYAEQLHGSSLAPPHQSNGSPGR